MASCGHERTTIAVRSASNAATEVSPSPKLLNKAGANGDSFLERTKENTSCQGRAAERSTATGRLTSGPCTPLPGREVGRTPAQVATCVAMLRR
jgi:hypothetical protein